MATVAVSEAEWLDAPTRERYAEDEFPLRTQRCPTVDYTLLQSGCAAARALYPNADKVVGLWTPASPTRVCVEVWTNGRASVYGFSGSC